MPDPYRTPGRAFVERTPCEFCGEETEVRLNGVAVCYLHSLDPREAQIERAARAIAAAEASLLWLEAVTKKP